MPPQTSNGLDVLQITRESAEVFYAQERLVLVGPAEVEFLKNRAAENPRKRSRLCTHQSAADAVHEMIIVHHRDCYVRPHRHREKSESLHVIEGSAQAVVFDDAGTVADAFGISGDAGREIFYYRMPPMRFHMLLITSEWLVFHETTQGPFEREQTEFPDWAPDGSSEQAAQTYMRDVRRALEGRSRLNRD